MNMCPLNVLGVLGVSVLGVSVLVVSVLVMSVIGVKHLHVTQWIHVMCYLC